MELEKYTKHLIEAFNEDNEKNSNKWSRNGIQVLLSTTYKCKGLTNVYKPLILNLLHGRSARTWFLYFVQVQHRFGLGKSL